MQQLEGPKRSVATNSYHFTPTKTRETATWTRQFSKGARYTYIGSSAIMFSRLTALIVSKANGWAQLGFAIVMLVIGGLLALGALVMVLHAIWKAANNYHNRNEGLWFGRHVQEGGQENWINVQKMRLYAIWSNMDSSMPVGALAYMFLSSIGGWLAIMSIVMGWSTTFMGAFFAGNWGGSLVASTLLGFFGPFIAISFYIREAHMFDDADQHEKSKERWRKIAEMEESRQMMIYQQQMSGVQPPSSVTTRRNEPQIGGKVNTGITAQFRTIDEPIDLPVSRMDDLTEDPRREK